MRLLVKSPAPFMNNLSAGLLHFTPQQANASLVEMTKVILKTLQYDAKNTINVFIFNLLKFSNNSQL